jgi:hypothetical protein
MSASTRVVCSRRSLPALHRMLELPTGALGAHIGLCGYSQSSPFARSRSPGYAFSFCSSAVTILPVSALRR